MKNRFIILLILFIIAFSCLPLFKNISRVNFNWDWLQMLSYYHFDRMALLEHHQWPLRTPYFGGGYPLIANPQDGSLNPFFIPVLIFGEVIGMKINALLIHLIAGLGMYYLTRVVLKYNNLGAFFSTMVFCLGGHMHRILIRGQEYVSLFYFFLMPLALACFIKAREEKRFLFYTVFILAVMASQAGLYFVPMTLFIFLFACLKPAYLKNFFIILLLTFLLGAVKFFPLLELLTQNPRAMDSYNPFWGPLLPNIYKAFFVHQGNFVYEGLHWNYFYLGYIPIVLALLSFVVYCRKTYRYLILLIIFGFLGFSSHTHLDLFKLFWPLPMFHSIEAPTRYFVPLVIFLIAVSAGQIFSISEVYKKRTMAFLLVLAAVFGTVDLFLTNGTPEVSFPASVPDFSKQPSFFSVKNLMPGNRVSPGIAPKMFETRIWEWTRPTQYELMLQNVGKINWYGNIHLGEYALPRYFMVWDDADSFEAYHYVSFLNSDYRGEIYFLNKDANKAEFKYFSPDKIVARVDVLEPDILVINQNYDKYWRSSPSKPISIKGLLAVKLEKKGTYQVTLTYHPLTFYLGLCVSMAALIFIIYSLCFSRHE